VTNKIYAVNYTSGTVTVIDGATNATTAVSVGIAPVALGVNPVTNQIYVANEGGNTVTVIDGATNTTTTVSVGSGPDAVAVNPVTNQIYVANEGGNTVTVIDGANNATTTVNVGTTPTALAVNPVTNQIYVANNNSNTVTVINGANNSTITVNVGTSPAAVAVNSVTNKIYVVNDGSNTVTVVEGATNVTSTINPGSTPVFAAINPVTNKIYVTNIGSSTVAVIDEQQVQPVPLLAEITALSGNVTASFTPAFNFTANSNFAPFAPNPDNLFFQVDTWQGPWTAATAQGNGAFTGQTAALQPGVHILYAYATDGQDATSTMGSSGFGVGTSPLISNIAAYPFLVSPPNASISPGSLNFGNQLVDTTSVEQTVMLANNSGGPLAIAGIAASGDYSAFSNCPAALDAGQSCTIVVSFTPSVYGPDNGTLTVTDDDLGVNGTLQTVSLTGTGMAVTTLSLTPTTLSFGNQALATTSAVKKVTVKNSGTGQLTFSNITITGADLGDFAQTNTCTGSFAPGKTRRPCRCRARGNRSRR
jgi:YVTN family beta-propeller protein